MEILIIVVCATLIIVGGIYSHLQKRKRIEALAALAARRGWQFLDDRDSSFESRFAGFGCLTQGSRRYAESVLLGASGSFPLCGFDYHYETYSTNSKGNRTTHHHHFSGVVIDSQWPLKPLLIRPETFFDAVGEFFGVDDIDFESHEFSKRFYVKAEDRRWAFDVIHQATMEFLLAAPQFQIQFAGSRAMAWRDTRFAPDEFEQAESVLRGILDRLPNFLHREWKEVQP